MSQDLPAKKKKKKSKSVGPKDDCNCPVCVFTKSQAPGNPYDLTSCPRWASGKKKKKK
ncbi:hypothetical protein KAR91_82085 [Candidatus Pacearchaeota archaeon]|nr:hypothetical protein [Candidatus Pacearchaeota archaeon]